MLQTILLFAFGFLCAAFLALLVAPAVTRRAARLARRRLERSLPISRAELEADRDGLRAEHALATRRVEMEFKRHREEASRKLIEVSREREALRGLTVESGHRLHKVLELETRAAGLQAELLRRDEQARLLTERLAASEKLALARAQELAGMQRLYTDASLDSSSRQIELAARETDVERLAGDREAAERRLKEAEAASEAARQALEGERVKRAELEKEIASLTAALAERTAVAGAEPVSQAAPPAAAAAEAGGDKSGLAALKEANGRLEKRVKSLSLENRRLKTLLAAGEEARAEEGDATSGTELRDKINDLAAEVVRLTAMLDGPDGSINKALATAPQEPFGGDSAGKVTSLADRVRALQQKAASR